MTNLRSDLEELRDQRLHDLDDLERQVSDGDLDPEQAQPLRQRYERALLETVERLQSLPAQPTEPPRSASRLRRWSVPLTVTGIGVAVVIALIGAVADRPEGGFVTGNEAVAGDTLSEQGRQASTDDLVAIVAQNPQVVGMRLALARRLIDEDRADEAVEHYLAVLEQQPHPEAMTQLGWLLFSDGKSDLAISLFEEALELEPTNPDALWFLANVELTRRERPERALELLERLQQSTRLDDRLSAEVDAAIADAERAAREDP